MSVTYLTEDDVARLVDVAELIDPIEAGFSDHATGIARDTARQRTHMPEGTLHVLQAASTRLDRIGFKSYFSGRTARTFHVHLIELSTGQLLAMVEADWLGILRTGAATSVATRHLARENASVLACFGTGRHSVIQARAVAAVRKIDEVRVVGRDFGRLETFGCQVEEALGVTPKVVEGAEAALDGADIVNIVTRSPTPLFSGTLLSAGQHMNAVGSNALSRREIDLEAVQRCDLIVVDSIAAARGECGDLLPAADKGLIDWHSLPELGALAAGLRAGRENDKQITLFESQGMGLLDIYAAHEVLTRAALSNAGRRLDF